MEYDESKLDSAGNVIETTFYDSTGEWLGHSTYGYDAAGNRTKHITYDSSGRVKSRHDYEYDANGNHTKHTEKRYFYDGSGTIGDWWYSDGYVYEQTDYDTVDSGGCRTVHQDEVMYDASGNVCEKRETAVEYDASEIRTKETVRRTYYRTQEITYGTAYAGTVEVEERYYGIDITTVHYVLYDSEGNIVDEGTREW